MIARRTRRVVLLANIAGLTINRRNIVINPERYSVEISAGTLGAANKWSSSSFARLSQILEGGRTVPDASRELTDEELVELTLRGHDEAKDKLWRRCWERIQRQAAWKCGDGPDFEGAEVEACSRIMEKLDRFDPERGSFAGWARAVAGNVFNEIWRRAKTYVYDPSTEEYYEETGWEPASDDPPLADHISLSMVIEEALASVLTEEERFILVRHHVRGHGYRELAKAVGKSEDAVRQQASRARSKLRDYFDGQGMDVDDLLA